MTAAEATPVPAWGPGAASAAPEGESDGQTGWAAPLMQRGRRVLREQPSTPGDQQEPMEPPGLALAVRRLVESADCGDVAARCPAEVRLLERIKRALVAFDAGSQVCRPEAWHPRTVQGERDDGPGE